MHVAHNPRQCRRRWAHQRDQPGVALGHLASGSGGVCGRSGSLCERHAGRAHADTPSCCCCSRTVACPLSNMGRQAAHQEEVGVEHLAQAPHGQVVFQAAVAPAPLRLRRPRLCGVAGQRAGQRRTCSAAAGAGDRGRCGMPRMQRASRLLLCAAVFVGGPTLYTSTPNRQDSVATSQRPPCLLVRCGSMASSLRRHRGMHSQPPPGHARGRRQACTLPTPPVYLTMAPEASRASRSCGSNKKGKAEEQATADQMSTLGAAGGGRKEDGAGRAGQGRGGCW